MKANAQTFVEISSGIAAQPLAAAAIQPASSARTGSLAAPAAHDAIAVVSSEAAAKGWVALLADLFKLRLTFLVLLTTLVGFYIGSVGEARYGLMLNAVFGT